MVAAIVELAVGTVDRSSVSTAERVERIPCLQREWATEALTRIDQHGIFDRRDEYVAFVRCLK